MAENGDKRIRDNEDRAVGVPPGSVYRQIEVFRSIVRHPKADTPRGRAMTSFNNFFLHVYPVKTPRKVLSFRSTFRLGFISAVLFVILFISGTYLMFFYTPAVPDAYFDMHKLATSVAFGQFVRNIHRWSAHLMVLVVLLHMLRVFYSGAYQRPRQFNWVIGMGLLVLTLACRSPATCCRGTSWRSGRSPSERTSPGTSPPGRQRAAHPPGIDRGRRAGAAALLRAAHLRPADARWCCCCRSTSGGSARTGSPSMDRERRGRRPPSRRPTASPSHGGGRSMPERPRAEKGRGIGSSGSFPARRRSAQGRSPTTRSSPGRTCWSATWSSAPPTVARRVRPGDRCSTRR